MKQSTLKAINDILEVAELTKKQHAFKAIPGDDQIMIPARTWTKVSNAINIVDRILYEMQRNGYLIFVESRNNYRGDPNVSWDDYTAMLLSFDKSDEIEQLRTNLKDTNDYKDGIINDYKQRLENERKHKQELEQQIKKMEIERDALESKIKTLSFLLPQKTKTEQNTNQSKPKGFFERWFK